MSTGLSKTCFVSVPLHVCVCHQKSDIPFCRPYFSLLLIDVYGGLKDFISGILSTFNTIIFEEKDGAFIKAVALTKISMDFTTGSAQVS